MTDYGLETATLLRRPSFLRGIARSIDLYGTLDRYRYKNQQKADYDALKRDWKAVGRDLFSAIKTYGSKNKVK